MVSCGRPVGRFFIPSCIVHATATVRLSSITSSFIIACAQANSWSITSISIQVEVRRSCFTCSDNPLTNTHANLWPLTPLNNTESFHNFTKYTSTNSLQQSHHSMKCSSIAKAIYNADFNRLIPALLPAVSRHQMLHPTTLRRLCVQDVLQCTSCIQVLTFQPI